MLRDDNIVEVQVDEPIGTARTAAGPRDPLPGPISERINYHRSRMNAQRWGIAVEGPITCRSGCPYRGYYEKTCCHGNEQPIGRPCLIEVAFAGYYAEMLRREHSLLVEHGPEKFEPLLAEAVRVCLLRERINSRWNRAWDLGDDMHSEIELCARYWTACQNRDNEVNVAIRRLYDEVFEDLERARWRQHALGSAIGSSLVPEPYRTWAMEIMSLVT